MKSIFIASAVILAATSAASAQTVQWRGGTFITAVTPGCGTDWSVGDYLNTRYRHPNLGGNGNFTGLSMFSNFYASTYAVAGPLGTAFKTTENAGQIGGGVSFFNNATTKMRFASRVPTAVTATTQSIVINGQIAGFGGLPTCTVTFRSTLGLRS